MRLVQIVVADVGLLGLMVMSRRSERRRQHRKQNQAQKAAGCAPTPWAE